MDTTNEVVVELRWPFPFGGTGVTVTQILETQANPIIVGDMIVNVTANAHYQGNDWKESKNEKHMVTSNYVSTVGQISFNVKAMQGDTVMHGSSEIHAKPRGCLKGSYSNSGGAKKGVQNSTIKEMMPRG
ncbi:hypothetical protein RJT34_09751 [Clitoria ternatea]|uniref:Uncharacterized protein n=1 Tax=Clitoria ternatea TaxID=43366 RepID=A0AAN9PVJ9_CLITE